MIWKHHSCWKTMAVNTGQWERRLSLKVQLLGTLQWYWPLGIWCLVCPYLSQTPDCSPQSAHTELRDGCLFLWSFLFHVTIFAYAWWTQSHLSAREGEWREDEMPTISSSCQYSNAILYQSTNWSLKDQNITSFLPRRTPTFLLPKKLFKEVSVGWINCIFLTLLLFRDAIVSFEVWGNVLTLSSLVQPCRNDNCIYIFFIKIGTGKRETTYLNPEYSQASYALLKKSPKELHMD